MNTFAAPAAPNRRSRTSSLREDILVRTTVRRLALGVLTLFLVSLVVFAATQLLPGDAAQAVLGRNATPPQLRAFRVQFGLDKSALAQYFQWLSHLLGGHLGNSLADQAPIWGQVRPRIVNSFYVVILVALIGLPIAVTLGVVSAMRRDRPFDHIVATTTLAAAALPEFVVAIALILIFATGLSHLLPPVSLVPPGTSVWDQPLILVLPVATLTIAVIPYILRMTRATMVEVLESEYVEMARLNGVPRRTILIRHALPNAFAPLVQAIALTLAYLAGGVVVVEFVFGYPGIGQGLVNAINARDLPTIQLIVLLLAAFYIAVNLIADIISILVTPKLRTRTWRT